MATLTYSLGCWALCTHKFGTPRSQPLTSQFCRPNYLVYVNTLLLALRLASLNHQALTVY